MIFETENYRNFFKAYIKLKGFTHEQFTKSHAGIISKPGLSVFLSRGRNLSMKTFFKLTQAMKLKPEESFYLYLVSLENDLDPLDKDTAAIAALLRAMRTKIKPALEGTQNQANTMSPELQIFEDALTFLNEKSVSRLMEALSHEIKVNIARQKHKNLGRLLLSRIQKIKT